MIVRWLFELRLLFRSRMATLLLLALATVSAVAVANGLAEVKRQQAEIRKLAPLQAADLAQVRKLYGKADQAGNAAYFAFHLTHDKPSTLAFAALGQRDFAPFVLRVRALALQGQLHDSETFNPESALAGRFDFAFVLIFLAPLFIVVLFHDLFSGERESGRWRSLVVLPRAGGVWIRRAIVRYSLVLVATLVPLVIGMFIAGTSALAAVSFAAVAAAYLAFWAVVSFVLASLTGSSVTHAARLLGLWAALTVALPVLAGLVVNRQIPADGGVDLTLAHRETLHGAWERPREETMRRFISSHPGWGHASQLVTSFEWKWYFAFHQNADESVAPQFERYRDALRAREHAMHRIGWALPPVGVQAILHRLADTDLSAQLRYQDSVIAFHRGLREYYYRYLFENVSFGPREFDAVPAFVPRNASRGSAR